MQKWRAKVTTLARERIERLGNIEIQLHTDDMQLHLILHRVSGSETSAGCEEHYRYSSVSALRDHLWKLLEESAAGGLESGPGASPVRLLR